MISKRLKYIFDKWNVDSLPIGILLITASILRIWDIQHLPFMHDEFSALFRVEYKNFSDLIRLGVMENDSHPAGVQVFLYYWTKMVGFSENWIKLPFIVVGIWSVWLIYSIGTEWFNKTVGLISASFLTSTQYFVFYSQLARPYATGLWAVLWLVHSWTKIIKSEKIVNQHYMVFSALLFLSAVMHAFSTFAAILIYFSGFLFISSDKRKLYIYSALGAILLYAPHIPVFYFQLKKSDIGGWLGAPSPTFLLDFLKYFFHFSIFFIGISAVLIVLSLITMDKQRMLSWKLRIAGLLWFSISFLTAYLFSIYKTPIIQFSTLYFTFPFVILILFSFFKPLPGRFNLLIVSTIMFIGISTLVFHRRHYETMYQQGYDQSAREIKKDFSRYGSHISVVSYSSTPRMLAFYLDKEGVKDYKLFSKHDQITDFQNFIFDLNTESIAFTLSDGGPADWVEIVRNKFPYEIHNCTWFNTEYFLFSKNNIENHAVVSVKEKVFQITDNQQISGIKTISIFDKNRIYGDVWQKHCDSIFHKKEPKTVSIITSGRALNSMIQTKIVLEIKDEKTNKILHWQSGTLNNDTILPGERFFLTTVLKSSLLQDIDSQSILKIYIWNPERTEFVVDQMKVNIYRQSPMYYGLFEPL